MEEERLLPTEVVAGEEDLHLGLVPSALPPGIVCVQKVDPGSWAERAGVQVGSEIRAINGKDVATMKGEAFRIHLKKRPVQFMLLPRSRAEQERAEQERKRAEADLRRLEEERNLVAKVREDMEGERRQIEAERKRMEEERERIDEERRRAEANLKELQERLAREEENRRLEELRRLEEEKKKQEEEERKKNLNRADEEKRAAWLKEQEEAMRRLREEEEKRRKEERRAKEEEERKREEEMLRLEKERLMAESLGPAPWDYGSYHAAKPVKVASGQRASVRLQEEIPEKRSLLAYQVTVDASANVLGIIPGSWPPNEVRVASVVANSAAAEHGVQVGDVLVSLDGELAQKMSRSALDSLLRKRPLVLGMTRCASTTSADDLSPEWVSSNRQTSKTNAAGVADAGNYEVNFNFDDRVLGFIPGSWPPGPVNVSAVVPDSSAYRLGVRSGDALVSLNGRDVMGMHRRELLAALRERPMKLVFLRGPGSQTVAQYLATEAIAEAMDEADLPDFSYTTDGAFMKTWDPPHVRDQQRQLLSSMKVQMQKPREQVLTLAQRAIRLDPSTSDDVPGEKQEHRQEKALPAESDGQPFVSSDNEPVESIPNVKGSAQLSEAIARDELQKSAGTQEGLSLDVQPLGNSSDISPGLNEPDVEPMPHDGRTTPGTSRPPSVPKLNLDGVGNEDKKNQSNPFQKKVQRTRNAAFVKMLGEFAKTDSGRVEVQKKEDEKPEAPKNLSSGMQRLRRADRALALFQGLRRRSEDLGTTISTAGDMVSELQAGVERKDEQQQQAPPDGGNDISSIPGLSNMGNETMELNGNGQNAGVTSKRLRKVRQLDIRNMLQSEVASKAHQGEAVIEPHSMPPLKDATLVVPVDRQGNFQQSVTKVKKLNIAAMVRKGVIEDTIAAKAQSRSAPILDISKIPGGDGSGPRTTAFVEISDAQLYGQNASLGINLRHESLIVIGWEVKQARDTWRLGDKIEAINGVPVISRAHLDSEIGVAKSQLSRHPIVFRVSRLTWGNDPVPKWTLSTDAPSSDVVPAGLSCPEPGSRPVATPQKRVNGLKTAKDWLRNAQQPQEMEYEKFCNSCGNNFMADSLFCRKCGTRRPKKPKPRQASPKPSRVAAIFASARNAAKNPVEPEAADLTWNAADLDFQKQRLAKLRAVVVESVAEVPPEEDEATLADLEAASLLLELGADQISDRSTVQRREEQEVSLAAAALLAELSPEMESLHEDWQRQQAHRTAARRELEVPSRRPENRLNYSVRV